MKKLIILFLFSTFCFQLFGANKYLRSAASGAGNGNNWTDAYTSLATLEANLSRGDTGYVADGSYSGTTLNTSESGSSLITIKKATVADHGTSTGWSDAYGDGTADISQGIAFGSGYWVIDGVSRASWTNGYGFKVTHDGLGFSYDGAYNNITVKYVEVQGHGDDGSPPWPKNAAFYIIYGGNNLVWSHCYAHDEGSMFWQWANVTDGLIEYCWSARNESTEGQHAEGVYGLGSTRVIFRNNVWVDTEGTGVIMLAGTDCEVYGNLIYWTGVGDISNGSIAGWSSYTVSNTKVYNNTIVVAPSGGFDYGINFTGGGSGNVAYNNLFYCSVNRSVLGWTAVGTRNYNWFYNVGSQSEANLQNGSGDPFVNSSAKDFALAANTTAGITSLGSPYNVDLFGQPRTTWTRGAIEYSSGGADTTAPTVSSRTINVAGNTLTVVYNESVTIGAGGSGGLTLSASGGAVTATYSSGSGTSTHVYNLSRFVGGAETVTANYTQPGNGFEDLSGNDLANYSTQSVTNSSTYESSAPTSLTYTVAPTPTRATSVTLTVTATDASALTYYLQMNGSSNTVAQASGVFNVSGLPVYSTNYFRFVATDLYGNAATSAYAGTLTWTQAIYTVNGTFTVPAGVTNLNIVECIGSGAGAGNNYVSARSGGGGGAYASTNNVTVTPAAVHTVTVGVAGAVNLPGEQSWFSAVNVVRAVGGTNSVNNGDTVGPGGAASSSVGQTRLSGGSGGIRNLASGGGGGGGGGASFAGAGVSGSAAPGSTGGAGGSIGGGSGGNSAASGVNGSGVGGGGGGAGESGSTSGTGFRGEVRIHWAPSGVPETPPGNDTTPPTNLRFLPAQLNNFLRGADVFELSIQADDNVSVASVEIKNYLNGVTRQAIFQGTNIWSEQIPIVRSKSNYITAVASDAAGNSATPLTFNFYEVGTNNATATSVSVTTSLIVLQ